MQLQSNTGRTGPGVCGCRVAFDLSSPTSFTCSHHLQSLVAIVLIDKYIILLVFSLPKVIGRKRETLHL